MIRLNKSGEIYDTRAPQDKLFSDAIGVCFTYKSDDISKMPHPSATPYSDRCDRFLSLRLGECASESGNSSLQIYELGESLVFEACSLEADIISEFGLSLPFNFMGKLGGGEWKNQFLFNSPYISEENGYVYAYLTKPNGCNLLVSVLHGALGWKMDYSDFAWGHYFMNLKMLSSYDRAFGVGEVADKSIKIALTPVSDFENALEAISRLYGVGVLHSELSGGKIGDKIALHAIGDCDKIIEISDTGRRALPFDGEYTIIKEVEVRLIPVSGDRMGPEITLYGYDSLEALYERSMNSIDREITKKYTDSNLCEHQCWLSALLRFLRKYAHRLDPFKKKQFEKMALSELDIITETDKSKATPHQTILSSAHEGYAPYNVYRSRRVQELFFGITILLDAYRYFGDEKYYEYACGATRNLLDNYRGARGEIQIDWGDCIEDYTTVCCPMIPLADMALFLRDRDCELSQKCAEACDKIALYLSERGLHFPTEGGVSDRAQEEMEDGSISCTALSLLYYCKNIRRDEYYIRKAKEILDTHESWVIRSQICQMKGSSLRWWETQWEGDADGPAICAGHAWSIWRAEADFLYYELSGDDMYLKKAKNGFMSNLSKIDKNGTTYSIYNPDRINGGGFNGAPLKIASRFSSIPDCGISRYVWIRLCDTFLR